MSCGGAAEIARHLMRAAVRGTLGIVSKIVRTCGVAAPKLTAASCLMSSIRLMANMICRIASTGASLGPVVNIPSPAVAKRRSMYAIACVMAFSKAIRSFSCTLRHLKYKKSKA